MYRSIVLGLLAVGAALLGGGTALGADKKAEVVRQLQGKWKAIELAEGGESETEKQIEREPFKFEVIDHKMTITIGRDAEKFKYSVEVKNDIVFVDLIREDEGVCHAILKFDKKGFLFCADHKFRANQESDRPVAFETDPKKVKTEFKLIFARFVKD